MSNNPISYRVLHAPAPHLGGFAAELSKLQDDINREATHGWRLVSLSPTVDGFVIVLAKEYP